MSESDGVDPVAAHSMVESRPPTRWLAVGAAAVVAVAAGLALTRGTDPAPTAEAATSTTAPDTTTTEPERSTTSPTGPETTASDSTTEPAPTTAVEQASTSGEVVDVRELPDDLQDRWLLVLGPELRAVHLGTGESLTITEHSLDDIVYIIQASDRGVLVADRLGRTHLVDWDLSSSTEIGTEVTQNARVFDDTIWSLNYTDETASTLVTIDADGNRTEVRNFPPWVQLIGEAEGTALVSSLVATGVFTVDVTGDTARLRDSVATIGGIDWLVELRCDDQLICENWLVDLRTDRDRPLDLNGLGFLEPMWRSDDGRRLLARDWNSAGEDGRGLFLFDADQMSVSPSELQPADTYGLGADPDLRFLAWRSGTALTIGDLITGDEWTLTRLSGVPVFTPPGWQPPVPSDEPSDQAGGA